MVPATLPATRQTERIGLDGRPSPEFRRRLRRYSSSRNAASVVSVWLQIGVVFAATWWSLWTLPLAFVLMGRAHAQLASLMHEAAHRLLFSNRALNDWVGRWLLGFPTFVPTDAYRRVHMAHHRDEFGPNEPDIPLYRGYPIPADSLRRKLVRDATGRTGLTLLRGLLGNLRAADPRSRRATYDILATQTVLLGGCVALGRWWLYPVLWLAPQLTVWRVINRLRAIAEHGGMQRSDDTRESTHSVRQHLLAQFILVPFNIGFHLAHHCDSGVPFRNLPALHRELRAAGYVDDTIEYPSYPAIWRALRR